MNYMCLRQGGQSLTMSPGIIALLALVGGVRAAPFVLCWRPCSELSLQIYLSSTRPSHGPLLLPFNAPSLDLMSPQASVPFTGVSAMSGAGCRWARKERIELWTPPKWSLLLATGSQNLLLFGRSCANKAIFLTLPSTPGLVTWTFPGLTGGLLISEPFCIHLYNSSSRTFS